MKNLTSERFAQQYYKGIFGDKIDDIAYIMSVQTIMSLKVPCLMPSEVDLSKVCIPWFRKQINNEKYKRFNF